jgi:hypothetical protein
MSLIFIGMGGFGRVPFSGKSAPYNFPFRPLNCGGFALPYCQFSLEDSVTSGNLERGVLPSQHAQAD